MSQLPNDTFYKWWVFRDHAFYYGFDVAYKMLRKRMGK